MADQERTFIAVALADEVVDRVVGLIARLSMRGAGVKWVERENLHVTLLFLGEVDLVMVPKVCRIVREQAAEVAPFELEITGMGGFPNHRRPKILWLGVGDGVTELRSLHDSLEPPLLELGCYRREGRDYTPHLTLGRVRSDEDSEAMGEVVRENAEWQGGRTLVNEILVLGSELRRGGPVYTVLGRAPCGRDAG